MAKKTNNPILLLLKHNSLAIYHGLSWMILFLFYTHFLRFFIPLQNALLHTSIYLTFIAAIFYFHSKVLIPRFFIKKRILIYLSFVLALLFLAAVVNKFYASFFDISFDKLKHHHQPDGTIRFIYSGTLFALIISALLAFIQKYKIQEQQKDELQNQKIAAELSMLKAQVNPHFLFNTLNNIYALSLDKSEPVVSEMILSLSEITRYMLYETEPEFVPLKKEIFYLNSYLDLEKLRCENTHNISISLAQDNDTLKITPLLLIPFIENAFKHSRIVDEKDAFIRIKLSTQNKIINFYCENSMPASQFKKDLTPGIGLENVRKRLQLIYPGKHQLKIQETEADFIVSLEIHT